MCMYVYVYVFSSTTMKQIFFKGLNMSVFYIFASRFWLLFKVKKENVTRKRHLL